MKKTLLLFIFFCLQGVSSIAQSGQWTWMKGDSIGNSNGIFGSMGIPDPLNTPPALYEPINWTDNEGNFWLFGGVAFNAGNMYSALWKFNPLTNNWIWIKGSALTNELGVYGTQGVPAAANNPGARGWGAGAWTDSTGNLWLFAGYGYDSQGSLGQLNDLWKYDIITNEWTWMKGSKFTSSGGSFGTQGIEAASNEVSARDEAVATWTGKNNYLWYFGGHSVQGDCNDLWKYNVNTNNWTWMRGSFIANQLAVYGIKGVSDPANDPGGRSVYSRWIDCDGNLWFFGGYLWVANGPRNDLWKYDPLTNEYTWMNGSSVLDDPGSAGNFCEFDSSFYPASRYESRTCWRDVHGDFWLFGGYVSLSAGALNDLWVYHKDDNEWSLISGSLNINEAGWYGQQGVYHPNNMPGGKMGPVSWMDHNGNLWLFGGNKKIPFSLVPMNDLWKYVPDTSCSASTAILCDIFSFPSFIASDTSVCEKFCVDFVDQSTNNPIAWEWIFPGGIPSSSTDQNPVSICYDSPGTYDITLITLTASGSDTLILSDYITVYATPPFPVITQNGNTLTSSPAASYQWQLNAVDIPGATSQSYTASQSGIYSVIVTDSNGCSNYSSVDMVVSVEETVFTNSIVSIFPNPSTGIFTVEISASYAEEVKVQLRNTVGQLIFSEPKSMQEHFSISLDLSNLPSAIYFLEIRSENSMAIYKLVKQSAIY